MRLGIISDAHHYFDAKGKLYTLTPLARQFEQWAALFDEVIICAPLLLGPPSNTASPYQATNIDLLPIVNAGGNTLRAKMNLVFALKDWWVAVNELLKRVDAVHIRCPNNISILGLLALARSSRLRQAVYTGNWRGYKSEPLTYRLQRWVLKGYFHGPVAVYGKWPNQPPHIVPSFSPSFSLKDWEQESVTVARKIDYLQRTSPLSRVLKLVAVGALDRNKNQQLAIHAVKMLHDKLIMAELYLLGDGQSRTHLEQLSQSMGLDNLVHFCGRVSHDGVREFYREADFVVQPSLTEGFSKVPVEGLVHGAIPILSDVSVNPQIVGGSARGRYFPTNDAAALAKHIEELAERPSEMVRLIKNGRDYSRILTLEAWQEHIEQMLRTHWVNGTEPRDLNEVLS
jgi:glycosyltransferase involved in cell wall biosynthesis